MRRMICTLLACAIAAGMFAGCQKDPESPIVVGKNVDRMIEKATQNDDSGSKTDKSLREQYAIPEAYQSSTEGADGKLTIAVDAKVDAPDKTAMPIYRVKPAVFSQETVSAFFEALCGDTEMWEVKNELTKAELQNEIIYKKKDIADNINAEGYENVIAEWEAELADMEKRLQTAPETIDEIRADGILREKTVTIYNTTAAEEGANAEGAATVLPQTNTYYAVNAYEKSNNGTEGKIFDVENGVFPFIRYFDCENRAAMANFNNSSSQPILDDSDIDAQIIAEVGIRPSEAMQMVQKLLDKTNSGMIVDSVYIQDDEQTGNFDGKVRPAEQYAYQIYCVRAANAVPCSAVLGQSYSEDELRSTWWYEELVFTVNGDGIANMKWICPLEITDTVSDNANLLPFIEIKEIFEKMMAIKHEPTAKVYSSLEFKINRAALSLHRIIEQNSDDSGLFIPAWNFYGISVRKAEDGYSYSDIGTSFLTINAIDGSIIDTDRGY